VSPDRLMALVATTIALTTSSACGPLPGKPLPSARPELPSEVTNFDQLYSVNCAGCHGADGHFGGALPLNNPTYLAFVDEASMRRTIANGITGTAMPAFAVSSGGMLTDDQITFIVNGIRAQWGAGARPVEGSPPYLSSKVGDVVQGGKLFGDHCASCQERVAVEGARGRSRALRF
jgi:cytochrome c oxidase cbb3-type subunit III